MEKQYSVKWDKGLDAFDRMYKPSGSDKEFVYKWKFKTHGESFPLFNGDLHTLIAVRGDTHPIFAEMLAFVGGYSGIPLKGSVGARIRSLFSDNVDINYANIRRIKEAHEKGKEAAIQDGELKLEQRLSLPRSMRFPSMHKLI